MSFITYIAADRVIGSHTSGNSYDKDFSCDQLNFSGDVDTFVAKSLSKKEETSFIGEEDMWSITVVNIDQADIAEWMEIFYSIKDGTSFTFDPYGTFAVPVDPDTYIMVSKKFAPRRVAIDTFSIPFVFKKEL